MRLVEKHLLAGTNGPPDRYRWIYVQECNHLIQDIASLISRAAGHKIDVSTEFESELWPVRTSAIDLKKAVLEVAVNAAEAVSEGGKISFYTRNVPPGKHPIYRTRRAFRTRLFIQIGISDNGCGMSQHIKNQILLPGFTTKNSKYHKGDGLYHAHQFINRMKGQMEIYTCEGIGSVFRMNLPATEKERPVAANTPSIQKDHCPTILLADNDIHYRNQTAELLKRYGCWVMNPESMDEARIYYGQYHHKIDMVMVNVSDMVEPAREFLDFIWMKNRNMHVLAVTGLGQDAVYHSLARQYPFDGHLSRPFTYLSLVRSVKKCLSS